MIVIPSARLRCVLRYLIPFALIPALVAAGAVIFIILGGTIIPFTVFLTGVKVIGPTKASLISCFEPLATILFTVLFLGTVLLPVDYLGMACILVTVFMLTIRKNT